MVGATPPAHSLVARLRRRDLDSEGEYERSFFEQQPPPELGAGVLVRGRRGEKEPRNYEDVLRVRCDSGAARVLANRCDRPDVDASAVVLGAYAWGRSWVLMRALRGRAVVTPGLAEQARALPYCQR